MKKVARRLFLVSTLFLMGNSLAYAESINERVVLNTLLLEARGEGLLVAF